MTDLQTQVEEWTAKGLELGWMVQHRGVTVLTEAYYTAKGQKPPAKAPGDWKEKYKEFIIQAAIPFRIELGGGRGSYTCNAYSIPGEQAFAQAMKQPHVDYSRLVQATKAHYADPRNTRHPIGKYFKDGLWESVYESYSPSTVQSQTFNIEL